MRYILFLLLILFACGAHAQVKTKIFIGGPLATNVYRGPLGSDSALYVVSNCGDPNTIIPKQNVGNFYSVYRGTLAYKDTCADEVWTSNPDSSWTKLNSSAAIAILLQTNGVDNSRQDYLNFQNSSTVTWSESNGTLTAEVPASTDNKYAIEDNVGIQNRFINYEGYNHEADSLGEMDYYAGDISLVGAASNIHLDPNAASYYSQFNDSTKAMFSTLNDDDSSVFIASATDNVNFLSLQGNTHGRLNIDITHPSNLNQLQMDYAKAVFKTGLGYFEIISGDSTYTIGSTGDFVVRNNDVSGGVFNSGGDQSYFDAINDGTFQINTTDSIFTPFYANTDNTKFFQPTSTGGWRLATPASSGGTVTSVGLAAPTIFNVSGSPVTTSGTLTFSPNNSTGDIIYGSAPNTLAYRSIGTTGQHLIVIGGVPVWRDTAVASAALTVGAFNNTSTANALDITAGVLTAHAADGTNPGAISETTQTLGQGTKTFSDMVAYGVTVSSATTLTLDNSTVDWIFTGTANTVWTLPAVLGNTGWHYNIKNRSTGVAITITLTAAGADNLYFYTNVATLAVNPGEEFMLINDGTYWVVTSNPWTRGKLGSIASKNIVQTSGSNVDTVAVANPDVLRAHFNVGTTAFVRNNLGVGNGALNTSYAISAQAASGQALRSFYGASIIAGSTTLPSNQFITLATSTTATASDVYTGLENWMTNNAVGSTQTSALWTAYRARMVIKSSSTTPVTDWIGYDFLGGSNGPAETQTVTGIKVYRAVVPTNNANQAIMSANGLFYGFYMDTLPTNSHAHATGALDYGFYQRRNVNYDSIYNIFQGSTAIGTGVTTPNSTLQVNGSFSTGYVAKTGTYTATASDYTINCTANTFTVTLPTAVGIAGRIYVITNSGAGTITIATTSSQTFTNVVATPTTLSLATVGATTVQSDGANWLRLSNL